MFEHFDWIGAMRTSPVMIIILGASVITLGFAMERALYFWKRRGNPEATLSSALASVRDGDLRGASRACASTPHPMGPVASQVLAYVDLPPDEIEERLQISLS